MKFALTLFLLLLTSNSWAQDQSTSLGDAARKARVQKHPAAKKALNEDASGCPELPKPKLVLTGTEQTGKVTRFIFNVTNWQEFPDALFAAAPDLPPCGLNKESSRTWIGIYAQDGTSIYGFCNLRRADDLNQIWFSPNQGRAAAVYITLNDRRCHAESKSNLVSVPNQPAVTSNKK